MRYILCLLLNSLVVNQITAQCDSAFFRYTGTFVKDVSLIDTNKIIGVGDNGYIIKSKDGGKSWKNIRTFNPHLLTAVQFASDSVGYAVGALKTVMKSEDQGENWVSLATAIPDG